MLLLALRQIIGFLVQIVPCAILCLMPFAGRYAHGKRRAFAEAAIAVAVPLVPFTALAFVPFPEGASDYRILAQNCLFILSLAGLLAAYVRNVRGGTEQKTLAFFSVACYGFVVALAGNAIIGMGLEEPFKDEYLYQPTTIVVFAVVSAVLFGPMAAAMKTLGQLFERPIDTSTWRHLAALPACILAIMLVAAWLPGLVVDIASSYYLALVTMSIMVVVSLVWVMRTARRVADDSQRATQLADALRAHRTERAALESELAQARATVIELERAVAEREAESSAENDVPDAHEGAGAGAAADDAGKDENAPIVIATSTHAVSFRPDDVLYVESLNRTRIVHLIGGEDLRVSTTLAQIYELLPASRFVYCHRSVVVNLDYVVEATPTEALLRGDVRVPMSRRRLADVTAALATRARDRA